MELNNTIYQEKRKLFDRGYTKPLKFRIEQLKKLKSGIKKYEKEILTALHDDFHKPKFEAFTSEIGILYEEINFTLKNLRKWMKPKRVTTPLVLELSRSKIIKEPKGVALVIGPWNYPFQLLISPLIGSIAAGNCTVLKPSNETPKTAAVIEKLVSECFEDNYVSVVQGPGSTVGQALIEQFPWNHIFFTGSPQVGKIVAATAAKHLSPITLELGGKSPAIIDENANIEKAAKRVVFGKFFNAGQTCVSPDYVLVHETVKKEFISKAKHYIDQFYGPNPLESKDLTHIVNQKRFQTLTKYLNDGKIIHGGGYMENKNIIEPTLIDEVNYDMPIMKDEIFGPILPIVSWSQKKELLHNVRKNRYPLACYTFSENKSFQNFIVDHIEFGGGSINNTLVHLVNPKLPFGGIGNSGMGNYHGKHSFDTFSHTKSILKSSTKIDLPLRYVPYTDIKLKIVKRFFN